MSQARCEQRIAITPQRYRGIGVGSFKVGSILIIGEKPARPQLGLNLPFAEMRGCSGWLNTLLEQANIDERKLTWVNAFDNYGTPAKLQWIINKIRPWPIICLGRRAEALLVKESDNDYLYFHHPQAWKRFHNKEPYPLIDKLIKLGAIDGV